MTPAALSMLWINCVERLKDRVNSRSYWEALESCRPITIENGELILGIEETHINMGATIQQPGNMQVTLEVVQSLFNQPLKIRIIEGVTLQDWTSTKDREVRVAAMHQAVTERRIAQDASLEGWDGVYEYVARLYVQTPLRALPQGKARYVNDALYVIADAMDRIYPDNPDEITERSLARILERIASASDIPAAILAFELERLRAWRRANPEQEEYAQMEEDVSGA